MKGFPLSKLFFLKKASKNLVKTDIVWAEKIKRIFDQILFREISEQFLPDLKKGKTIIKSASKIIDIISKLVETVHCAELNFTKSKKVLSIL
jgi:hypothetical protein